MQAAKWAVTCPPPTVLFKSEMLVQTPQSYILPANPADGAGCVTVRLADPAPARPVRLAPRPAVLVTVAPDGFVECYASPGVRVAVVERLAVEPADEALAEQYLETTLPAWARDIYQPVDLVATLAPRPATPAEELDKVTELAVLRGLRELGAERKGGRHAG